MQIDWANWSKNTIVNKNAGIFCKEFGLHFTLNQITNHIACNEIKFICEIIL